LLGCGGAECVRPGTLRLSLRLLSLPSDCGLTSLRRSCRLLSLLGRYPALVLQFSEESPPSGHLASPM
jgi:hypothetical protein